MEKDLKQVRNEYADVSYELSRRDNVINEQKKLIDDFQIEREHIKQIITCNIDCFDNFDNINLNTDNDDFHRLLSILDIKPEDYKDSSKPMCCNCVHNAVPMDEFPCNACDGKFSEFIKKEDNNAETTD